MTTAAPAAVQRDAQVRLPDAVAKEYIERLDSMVDDEAGLTA